MERVFISYRRKTSKYAALLVFKDLTMSGYDVFIDYENIDSGKFESEIYRQISSRYHFVAILSPGCFERTKNQEDWFRKEIEYAIDKNRNIVPLMFDRFIFEDCEQYFTGKLSNLSSYNGVNIPDGFFDEAMAKLKRRFLKQPPQGIVKTIPEKDHLAIEKIMQKARNAANQDDFFRATFKYTGNRPITNKNWTPNLTPKSQIKKKSAAFPVAATTDSLGRNPIDGEQIFFNEKANKSFWFSDHDGKIIITNNRFIFIDHDDDTYSFEIPIHKLRNAKFKESSIFGLSIHLTDGIKYANLSIGFGIRNKIEKIVKKLAK